MRPHNFSAGPSILPLEVFEQAQQAIHNFAGTGLSILEVSHRGAEFDEVMHRAVSLVKELLGLSEEYHVIFLGGGASSQFFMTAMNFLSTDGKAYYIDTGTWSSKAIKEAQRFGRIEVLASSKDEGYRYIPKPGTIPTDGDYLHITSNNTITGSQYHVWPETNMPIVCDASSDIFSRPLPIEKFGCIYAGAQKNMGPAGVTLLVIREDMLGKTGRDLPTMLDFRTHISKNSMFNTPPVFPIYVSMLTMEWIKKNGGVRAIQKINEKKAAKLYACLDDSELFHCPVQVEDRSLMNVVFMCKDDTKAAQFLDRCKENQISGIKGHRSVGGFRASIYNAMPESSVDHLIRVIEEVDR